jgi:hypothetical protein
MLEKYYCYDIMGKIELIVSDNYRLDDIWRSIDIKVVEGLLSIGAIIYRELGINNDSRKLLEELDSMGKRLESLRIEKDRLELDIVSKVDKLVLEKKSEWSKSWELDISAKAHEVEKVSSACEKLREELRKYEMEKASADLVWVRKEVELRDEMRKLNESARLAWVEESAKREMMAQEKLESTTLFYTQKELQAEKKLELARLAWEQKERELQNTIEKVNESARLAWEKKVEDIQKSLQEKLDNAAQKERELREKHESAHLAWVKKEGEMRDEMKKTYESAQLACMKEFLSMRDNKKNSVKGKEGENIVEDALREISSISYKDTSRDGNSGDFQFEYKNLSAMIEVKNHETIKTADVEIFLETLGAHENLNSGIFVSIYSTIPHKGNIYYEYINRKVVAYVNLSTVKLEQVVKGLSFFRQLILAHEEYKKSTISDRDEIIACAAAAISDTFSELSQLEKIYTANANCIETLSASNRDLQMRISGISEKYTALMRIHKVLDKKKVIVEFTEREVKKYMDLSAKERRSKTAILRAWKKSGNNEYFSAGGGFLELLRRAELLEC